MARRLLWASLALAPVTILVDAVANPGKVALHLIEVQSGGYLGEDDIVRFDDRYKRN